MPEQQSASTTRFSPRASLAAMGLKLQELKLFETIKDAVNVPQKKAEGLSTVYKGDSKTRKEAG